MGGTSFDVCLVQDGRLPHGDGLEIEYGMPLQIPALDIHTIGAGGGSIGCDTTEQEFFESVHRAPARCQGLRHMDVAARNQPSQMRTSCSDA